MAFTTTAPTEADGRSRADAALAAASASGDPLLDPLGRARSPITLPEYRKGRRPANAGRRFPAEILTSDEIIALLDQLSERSSSGVRDRALIALLWRAGLRIGEAIALHPKDLDLDGDDPSITILRGKGAKRRTIGIDPAGVTFIKEWLNIRQRLAVGEDAPLFCTVARDALGAGRPMSSSAFRQTLKRCAKQAGIRKRVHAHGLRHTHAHEIANENIPLHVIRDQLGHSDLSMTAHYIGRIAPVALVRAISQRESPAGLLPPRREYSGSALSQGQQLPAPSETAPRAPTGADLSGTPTRASGYGQAAASGRALQRVLDVLASNHGSASQEQLTLALGVTKGATSQLCAKLASEGLITGAGWHRRPGRGGPPSKVWRLAPPKATVTIGEPHDPRALRAPVARRGYGSQRVLAVIEGLGGRASQAQIARELGIGATTIAKHCKELEFDGKVTHGGLDKTGTNRGSQVWRIPSRATMKRGPEWRHLRVNVPLSGSAPAR